MRYKIEKIPFSQSIRIYFVLHLNYRTQHKQTLFPYPTISDYIKIKSQIDTDILNQPTNQEVFHSLLEFLNPKFILIFGITNLKTLSNLYSIYLSNPTKFTNKKASCNLWKISYQNRKGMGLSVNLGNPRGFDSVDLNELGKSLLKG